MEQRVSLITLGVADIPRARQFYEALGWRGQEAEETVFFQAGVNYHGLRLSHDGRTMYVAEIGNPTDGSFSSGGLRILDVSEVQDRKPDPQVVPQQLLDRGSVQDPQRVLDAGFWKVLREQRDQPGLPDFHQRLREQLGADLGSAYGPVVSA